MPAAGFAVVAAEVRSLAKHTAQSAKEVESLIVTMVNKVKEGSGLVSQTSTAMTGAAAGISRAYQIIETIAAGAREQNEGIDDVTRSLASATGVTQQNLQNAQTFVAIFQATGVLRMPRESLCYPFSTANLSAGGACLLVSQPMRTGRKLSLEFDRGNAEIARISPLQGRVVQSRQLGPNLHEIGMQFRGISAEVQDCVRIAIGLEPIERVDTPIGAPVGAAV